MRSTLRGALRGSHIETELRPVGWLTNASGVRVRHSLNDAIERGRSRP